MQDINKQLSRPWENKDWLKEKYMMGLSNREIAEKLPIPKENITYWLNKFHINEMKREKACEFCGKLFSYKHANRKYCNSKCNQRANDIKRKYDLTIVEYKQMYEDQNKRCKICGKRQNIHEIHVDHDHETGEIRGLLCSGCNRGLGGFKDNQLSLIKGVKYLSKGWLIK